MGYEMKNNKKAWTKMRVYSPFLDENINDFFKLKNSSYQTRYWSNYVRQELEFLRNVEQSILENCTF